jgi:hypothetical protein
MRRGLWILALVVLVGFAAGGCRYKNPDLRAWYDKVVVDMDRADVVEILGDPTFEAENEMLYLYDTPEEPARFRFVLDENDVVVERHFETKDELEAQAKAKEEALAPGYQPLPGEEEERPYPGGPLPGFGAEEDQGRGY